MIFVGLVKMIRATLVIKSIVNRWLSCFLIILTLSSSISLFFIVTRIQESVKTSFQNTVSGVDSVVSARGGDLQILLNAVFLIGQPSQTIKWETFKNVQSMEDVNFSIPISLGDSHKGYKVVGTNNEYFEKIKYSRKKSLEFAQGKSFSGVFDVVLGSVVAKKLDYSLGSNIGISHGLSEAGITHSFINSDDDHDEHEDHEKITGFAVAGILAPTGTPIDNAVYIHITGYEAVHKGWIGGQKVIDVSSKDILEADLEPKTISAIFVSLKNRTKLFQFQREINSYKPEALTAVMPGITLSRLWKLTGNVDKAFKIITAFIILIALLGMMSMTIAGLNSRRREMAILRSVGASPGNIVGLLLSESVLISILSCILGYLLMIFIFYFGKTYLENSYGIFLEGYSLKNYDIKIIIAIVITSLLATIIPAIQIYRNTLRDGLSVKS
tara:strand:- start:881 stop:2203 length:1323 start_codon:yes stop_codon:yes gene_type:complete